MRFRTEWLVAPLFLFPALFVGGFVWWSNAEFRRARAPYIQDGRAEAVRWLADGGQAAWMKERVAALAGERPPRGIHFEHPVADGIVRRGSYAPTEPWTFTDELASPLSPALLSDASVRLKLETGLPPADVDGAAHGAVALRDLLRNPDLDALRSAPLPPSTKRYVLERWRRRAGGPTEEIGPWADEFLRVVEAFVASSEAAGAPLSLGAHGDVLAFGETAAARIYDRGVAAGAHTRLVEEGPSDSPVRLVWSFPEGITTEDLDADEGEVVWFGRIEKPLAGTFVFREHHD